MSTVNCCPFVFPPSASTSKLKLYFRAMSTQGNETVDLESRWWMLEEERQRREKEEIEKRWVAQVGTLNCWANKGLFYIYIYRETMACPGRGEKEVGG